MPRIPGSTRLAKIPKTTVWTEFTPLAIQHKAINLGQGFPSFSPPEFVHKNVKKVLEESEDRPMDHQYARSLGDLRLVNYLQSRYKDLLKRDIALDQILVLNGATNALNCAAQALLSQGDEAIIIEPYFDVYMNDILLAGGTPVPVPMVPHKGDALQWTLDLDKLKAAITPKTKLLFLNTPQNVPGKVWSQAELEDIAKVAIDNDVFVISDEVYEHMTFDGTEHLHIANIPGMWERTLTISSSGKTLSATGWKIGWVVAPQDIIAALMQVHAQQSFSVATPLQIAVAQSLQEAEKVGYYAEFRDMYQKKRDLMCSLLDDAGLTPVVPQGSFFVLADISKINPEVYSGERPEVGNDWRFCRWMTKEIGVTAIPTTAFCSEETRPLFEQFARFGFCKEDHYLVEGGKRLKKLKEFML